MSEGTDVAKNLVLGTLAMLAAKALEDFEPPNNETIADWIGGYALEIINDEG